jgi:hypothetical protein
MEKPDIVALLRMVWNSSPFFASSCKDGSEQLGEEKDPLRKWPRASRVFGLVS